MTSQDTLNLNGDSLTAARIDWGRGRIIGFSVPASGDAPFDVVRLYLGEHCVMSAVANLSVFEMARDLAGLRMPSREQSAFELRIPQGGLLPRHLGEGPVALSVRTAAGVPIFETTIDGARELLHLTEGAPVDLLFEVNFRHVQAGAVQGVVRDRHGAGVRPSLQVRLNDHPGEPLAIFNTSADGLVHHFSHPLRADRLHDGVNSLHITSETGQPLASYPIQLGLVTPGDVDRRVAALEAEVSFLKHLVLNQNAEALPARLALLKGEIVGICSEMLTLQRTNLEREFIAKQAVSAPGKAPR
jgi:hypothetical protein